MLMYNRRIAKEREKKASRKIVKDNTCVKIVCKNCVKNCLTVLRVCFNETVCFTCSEQNNLQTNNF